MSLEDRQHRLTSCNFPDSLKLITPLRNSFGSWSVVLQQSTERASQHERGKLCTSPLPGHFDGHFEDGHTVVDVNSKALAREFFCWSLSFWSSPSRLPSWDSHGGLSPLEFFRERIKKRLAAGTELVSCSALTLSTHSSWLWLTSIGHPVSCPKLRP